MRIDSSRYTMFWSNPERYRLREVWKLAPIEPAPGTFASLLTFGRRRGTCLHEFRDGAYRQVPIEQTVQELRDGGFGDKEIAVAREMAEKIAEVYAGEEYLAHEVLFESSIVDSPHLLVGRIDHIIRRDESVLVGDWKSSKARSKADKARKLDEYCRSAQVSFYLLGARSLGFDPAGFVYRLVSSGKPGNGVEIDEQPTTRTGLQLKEFARGVHMTCELIEFLKREFGVEKPWPSLSEVFKTGYESIEGSKCYEGYIPDGYEPKKEHLSLMEANDGLQA